MAEAVYLHVGLPKTGTTYLQSILWANKAAVAEQGLLLPGASSRHHLWASGAVREDPHLAKRHPQAPLAWERLVEEIRGWPGRALVSHEFFAAASADQVARVLADLAPAAVHVVVTARDTLTVVTSYWQEYVKHGFDVPLEEFPGPDAGDPTNEWSWRTVDLASVLDRWTGSLPPDRVHVLVVPGPDQPREALWWQFAELLGVDPAGLPVEHALANGSLGLVEAELLRRVAPHLRGFRTALDRGVWVRGYLAQEKLVPRQGERFLPSPERVEELRRRAAAAVALVRSRGFDVRGDLDRLLVPEQLPQRRHPADVSETELLAAATETIAGMMTDLRALRRENTELRRAAEAAAAPVSEAAAPAPSRVRRAVRALRPRRR